MHVGMVRRDMQISCDSELRPDVDCYTEAQCEAMVTCGNNHWIITPNLTRSIQLIPGQGDRSPVYGNQ